MDDQYLNKEGQPVNKSDQPLNRDAGGRDLNPYGDGDGYRNRNRGLGRIGAGLFVVLVGGVLLLDQMGFPLPDWLFNWHIVLIAIGLFVGLRHNFKGGAWLMLILIGGFFLVQDYYPRIPLHRFLWPAVLIFVGLVIVLSPGRSRRYRREGRDWDGHGEKWRRKYAQHFASVKEGYSSEDFVDSTAIFGGVHKKIVSKNFRGGDITSIMGGTELDMTQADFAGMVRLDVTQIMGATKIIVPAHWEVRSEITALFAGYEDKRQQPAITNPDKVLILQGTSIFGGIELKNY